MVILVSRIENNRVSLLLTSDRLQDWQGVIDMLIFGKQITDECSRCGQVLECELFRQGHGIKCDRQNISKMLECQFEHREKRENGIWINT